MSERRCGNCSWFRPQEKVVSISNIVYGKCQAQYKDPKNSQIHSFNTEVASNYACSAFDPFTQKPLFTEK